MTLADRVMKALEDWDFREVSHSDKHDAFYSAIAKVVEAVEDLCGQEYLDECEKLKAALKELDLALKECGA